MATEAVLDREEHVVEQADADKQPARPRLYKRLAGTGVSMTFPVPPEMLPKHWFE
jgi:hypothetical protein